MRIHRTVLESSSAWLQGEAPSLLSQRLARALEQGREHSSPRQPPPDFMPLLAERSRNLEGKKGVKCPTSTARTRVCKHRSRAWQTPTNAKYCHTLRAPGAEQRDPLTSSLPPAAPAVPANASRHESPPRTQVNVMTEMIIWLSHNDVILPFLFQIFGKPSRG